MQPTLVLVQMLYCAYVKGGNFKPMTASTPSYPRTPSEELQTLLSSGGFLAPLVDLNKRQVAGVELDVHLRTHDEVQVYCGLTRLLVVRRNRNGTVNVSAEQAYSKQECAKAIIRQWSTNRASDFRRALDAYLRRVEVARRHIDGEGSLQSRWSRVTNPWIPFDREAVLSYSTQEESTGAREIDQVNAARSALEAIVESRRHLPPQGGRWIKVPPGGREVDQLAVDSEGRLALLELKNASASSASVYYTPFQLLHYIWEWHNALEAVRQQLQGLLDSRVALGLTPGSAPALTGGIRAAVCFGRDTRSGEVERRYQQVLQVVNQYLPSGVPSIETWTLEDRPSPA